MQDKFRLYRRPNGTFYAEEYQTRHRESMQTKDEAEARRLIVAKNQAAIQPVFNLEMAKVYLKAHDPHFCERTWSVVSDAVQHTHEGSTKARWEKFIRSEPVQGVIGKKLIQTTSSDFLAVLNHAAAGISTNVFFRILHNRALDLGWIVQPVLQKRAGRIRYMHCRGGSRSSTSDSMTAGDLAGRPRRGQSLKRICIGPDRDVLQRSCSSRRFYNRV
jgi:hypothetical protein